MAIKKKRKSTRLREVHAMSTVEYSKRASLCDMGHSEV